MQFAIVHEIPGVQGRLRARAASGFSLRTARYMAEQLGQTPGLAGIRVHARAGSVLLWYTNAVARHAALEILGCFGKKISQQSPVVPDESGGGRQRRCGTPAPPRSAETRHHPIFRPLLSYAVKAVAAGLLAAPFLFRGLKALCRGRFNREVLEAAVMGGALLRRDFGVISFLAVALGVGEALESRCRSLLGGGGHAGSLRQRAVVTGLLPAGLVWLMTRNPIRALTMFLAWCACAARLAPPLLVLAARVGDIPRFRAGNASHIITAGVVLYALCGPSRRPPKERCYVGRLHHQLY